MMVNISLTLTILSDLVWSPTAEAGQALAGI
jgi:hypothetical protein